MLYLVRALTESHHDSLGGLLWRSSRLVALRLATRITQRIWYPLVSFWCPLPFTAKSSFSQRRERTVHCTRLDSGGILVAVEFSAKVGEHPTVIAARRTLEYRSCCVSIVS